MQAICVFCGSNFGSRPAYETAARTTGAAIAEKGLTLVYGGAKVGLMGAVADGALEKGGRVIGVLPKALQEKELAHEGLDELHIVTSMHERKAKMADLSDGFISLPGGAGTMEEMFEVWTWGQLGFHDKPCGFLNVDGFYDHLLTFLDHQTAEGFIKKPMRDMVITDTDPARMLDHFAAYSPPTVSKWIRREET